MELFEISAAAHQGTRELVKRAAQELQQLPPVVVYEPTYVERPPEVDTNGSVSIEKFDDTWVVEAPWLQRLIANVNFSDFESRNWFDRMLRQSGLFDKLEQMGIQRTMSSIERAQIVIYMTDAARLAAGAPVAPEFPLRADQKLLVLVNKTDTAPDCPLPEGTIGISARNGDGIESLRRILRSFVDTEALYHGDAIVSNNRHYEALTAAGDALRRALDGLNNSLQTDLLSEEIRQVIHHVGSVTGRNSLASEEVLKHIFSKHCVGK